MTSASEHLYFQGAVKSRPAQAGRTLAAPRTGTASPVESRAFFQDLFAAAGVHPEGYRAEALNRRVSACLRHLGARSLQEARAKLGQRPDLVPSTVSVSLLGVTDFFRDEAVFNQLRALLPGLGKCPRVWSAACSDGHELYSVALLLHSWGLLEGADLLGTDCRRQAIDNASSGVFSTENVLRVSEPWRQVYFQAHPPGQRIIEPLRRAVRWEQADLLCRTEPGPWDVILWRNMAIYLEAETARMIWGKLFDQLAPGGLLVTGKADHPPAPLQLERLSACLYRKRLDRP